VVDELALASVLLSAVALISCLSVKDKRVIRRMPRALWVITILLVPLAGSITWFLLGRPRTLGAPRTVWRVAVGLPEPPRPRAPDDDPDFLRSLDRPPDGSQEEERLRRREEDLKRRRDEQHHSDPEADG
jgi:hypothetical protein